MTTFEEFKKLSADGNVIPVYETLMADTETPVSVYLKIQHESPYSFLLESAEGGDQVGRYSFIGFNPFMNFTIRGRKFSLEAYHDDVRILPTLVSKDEHPLAALKKIFDHIRTVRSPGLPRLSGGAVGYFGYESVQLVEDIPVLPQDELEIPDAMLLFYDVVLVFDNLRRRMFLVSNAYLPDGDRSDATMRAEYAKAIHEIAKLKDLMRAPVTADLNSAVVHGDMRSVTSKEDFCAAVERSRDYIVDGDIFQVVLSQRLEQHAQVDPFDLYRSLRMINPSPYMYFLRCKDFEIIGASPEMLVRVDDGVVETRPIAGTRRRGVTREEDERLEKELLADPKERAEHLMLVDLGRNDLGRICSYGSVQVEEYMTVEKYSHVMHLVTNVRGRLRSDLTQIDALFSCFPAGTLTGAPKIRAMEIIGELEPVRRGVYGGSVAYIDFSGNLDSCIAIRTMVTSGDLLRFQAGAGIVYDSNPEREYEETLEKLRANLKALDQLRGASSLEGRA
ncbi:MAG TPA: anthranilate synthase component I [Bacteroidota bacterium]|nr:anthranilate synthase component I [Bacteroidota bacterium]